MFSIRTTASSVLARIFDFGTIGISVIRNRIFLINTEQDKFVFQENLNQTSAGYIVSPNRTFGEFISNLFRALFQTMGSLVILTFALIVDVIRIAISPITMLIGALRGQNSILMVLITPVYATLLLPVTLVSSIFNISMMLFSPLTRLVSTVRWLFDPDGYDANGETDLTRAMKNDDLNEDALLAIIDNYKGDLSLSNIDGETPLTLAIKNDKKRVVQLLLKTRPSLSAMPATTIQYQKSAFKDISSAWAGQSNLTVTNIIENPLVIAMGGRYTYSQQDDSDDVSFEIKIGREPQLDVIKLLLDAGANPLEDIIVAFGNPPIKKSLIDLVLLNSQQNGSLEIIKMMIVQSASPNNAIILDKVIQYDMSLNPRTYSTIEYLLDNNVDFSGLGYIPLMETLANDPPNLNVFKVATDAISVYVKSPKIESLSKNILERLIKNAQTLENRNKALFKGATDYSLDAWYKVDPDGVWQWAVEKADIQALTHLKSKYPISLNPLNYLTSAQQIGHSSDKRLEMLNILFPGMPEPIQTAFKAFWAIEGDSPIVNALAQHNTDFLCFLLENKIDITPNSQEALHTYISNISKTQPQLEFINMCLKASVDGRDALFNLSKEIISKIPSGSLENLMAIQTATTWMNAAEKVQFGREFKKLWDESLSKVSDETKRNDGSGLITHCTNFMEETFPPVVVSQAGHPASLFGAPVPNKPGFNPETNDVPSLGS